MASNRKEAGPPANPALLVKIAAGGCLRTRSDVEHIRDEILRGGYERDYLPLYRAILAILGDTSALNLPEPQRTVAMKAYLGMKREYIGNSECRCLRNGTGGVATNLTSCPVHGTTAGARMGMRNFTGLIR